MKDKLKYQPDTAEAGGDKHVTVTLSLKVDGNILKKQEKYYERNRGTFAFTLEQFARVILIWDRIFDSSGTTYAYDGLMQKMEKKLPSETGDTAETLFKKYWIDFEKTIEEEFAALNSGNDSIFPEADDYLTYRLTVMFSEFQKSPMLIKQGFLYWFFKYAMNESTNEIESDYKDIPQRIKELIDNKILRQT